MHAKSLREFPAMTYETSNVIKRVSSPDLLIFNQFQRHILKYRTKLSPTTFIETSEKIKAGLKNRLPIFNLISPGERLSDIPVSTFFPALRKHAYSNI